MQMSNFYRRAIRALQGAALALTLLAAAMTALTLAAPHASAEDGCDRCDRGEDDGRLITLKFPVPSGGETPVRRIVVLTSNGAYAADMPARAPATFENRVDLNGLLGGTTVVARLFDRPLLAYVAPERRVGAVYLAGDILFVDVSDLDDPAAEISVETGALALLTRARSPYRLVGHRLSLEFAPAVLSPEGAQRVGDAYHTPDGLVIAPPPSALPGI